MSAEMLPCGQEGLRVVNPSDLLPPVNPEVRNEDHRRIHEYYAIVFMSPFKF